MTCVSNAMIWKGLHRQLIFLYVYLQPSRICYIKLMFSDCTSVLIVSTDKPKTTKIKEDEGMKILLIK